MMEKGWAARREGDLLRAREYLTEAIALLKQQDHHHALVTALGRLGHVEMDAKNWDAAQTCYEAAIEQCQLQGDVAGQAHKTRHLGDVFRHRNQPDQAASCYEAALALYRSLASPPILDLANAIRMVALSQEHQQNLGVARKSWQEAHALYAQLGLQEGMEEADQHLDALK